MAASGSLGETSSVQSARTLMTGSDFRGFWGAALQNSEDCACSADSVRWAPSSSCVGFAKLSAGFSPRACSGCAVAWQRPPPFQLHLPCRLVHARLLSGLQRPSQNP